MAIMSLNQVFDWHKPRLVNGWSIHDRKGDLIFTLNDRRAWPRFNFKTVGLMKRYRSDYQEVQG